MNQDPTMNAGEEAGSLSASSDKTTLVLVVDDDPSLLKLMELIKEYLQLEIKTATTAESALEMLQKENFDCMLLDCNMPVVDGFEFAKLWRTFEKHRTRRRMPIIAVTGLRSEQTARQCFDSGMDAYVTKPLDMSQLKDTITQLIATQPEPPI